MLDPSPSQTLIDRLVADARPVRRLWPPWARLAAWWTPPIALLFLVERTRARADLIDQVSVPLFVVEVGACALGALLLGWLALRAAVPGREPGWGAVAASSLPLLGALLLWRHPIAWDVALGGFAAGGIPCAAHTFAAALPPWVALLLAARRGAPLAAMKTGALVGAGGLLAGYVAMRLICPVDEALHVFVWHALPVAAGVGVSAAVGAAYVGRWRR